MVGVPTHWRSLDMDAVKDPKLLDVLKLADIISPWTVGRYGNTNGAAAYARDVLKPDITWCTAQKIDYLPVLFPGFSWFNMYGENFNRVPRQRGQFLWTQFMQDKLAGASMTYVAMFDEVDEGTAIFKCVNDVPQGQQSEFVTYENLPSDFYLKLVGKGTRLIRGEISLTENSRGVSGE